MTAPAFALAEAREEDVHTYRIGWWTHRWWPNVRDLHQIATGWQPNFRDPIHRTWKTRRSVSRDALRRSARRLKMLRRPHRPWQAEYGGCRWCRRGWTAEGVQAKAAYDRSYLLATGEWSPWVQRKVSRSAR